MKRWLGLLGLCFSLSYGVAATAAELAPDALVRNVTTEVLDILQKDTDLRDGNTKKTLDLVETKILPHFNFQRMTLLALGREARKANPEQIKALSEEFRDLLVRTYSRALTEFSNHKIAYKPFKMAPAETDVKVRTEVKQTGGKPVQLDYYLEKTPAGWKVYDVEVGGVSLVTNYRSSFAQEISANGVDGLLRSLQAKNKTSGADGKSK
jgi:phospholipid transport system substrate-binding protein